MDEVLGCLGLRSISSKITESGDPFGSVVKGLVSEPWLPGLDSRAVHARSVSGLFAIEAMYFKSYHYTAMQQ